MAETLTADEIERLSTEGVDIPLDEVRVLNDGTYVYKGKRVIVYIRDVADYARAQEVKLPRFHLSMCDTIARMMEERRYEKRYVVATRDDGYFSIQMIRQNKVVRTEEKLDICQHCLAELSYKGFSGRQPEQSRRRAVESFSLQEFFESYGRSCVWAMPRFDEANAPSNLYSASFYRIAKMIKERRGYCCEAPNCRINLSNPDDQRYLHAHHIDGDKSNNHSTNIRLLCIRCHSQQFLHSHMKDNPDFARFVTKYPIVATTPSPD
jgi:hypothetical protein